MMGYKRGASVLLLIVTVHGWPSSVSRAQPPEPGPAPPTVNPLDQQYLTRFVRRTLEQHVRDDTQYEPAYRPPGLQRLECQVLVTIRQHGYHRGTGISQRAPIIEAAREAALLAYDRVRDTGPFEAQRLAGVILEIEVVGEDLPLPVTADKLLAGPAERYLEPGIHGLVLSRGPIRKRFCPSQLVASNTPLSEAVVDLAEAVATSPEQLAETQAARFRTVHWVEREPGGEVVELVRGLQLVPPSAVGPDDLAAAVERMAAYIRYRQRPSGRFSYQYEPSIDRYTEDDNEVRQAAVTWLLCDYARRTNDADVRAADVRAAADRALDRFARRVVDLRGVDGAGFVAAPDGKHKLGLTALVCLAMSDHPRAPTYRVLRDKLVKGMLWLQQPSGKLVTAFPPSDVLGTQEYYPGEALTALARAYEDQPQQPIMEAFDRAIGFYRDYFRRDPSAAFAAWHIQAFARMATHSRRDDFAEFVFALADALVDAQKTERNCPWPDAWGGIASNPLQAPDSATALYLQGLTDALALARSWGDSDRAERYEQAVRRAARFVMQLEFRPGEAYYVRSRPDTIGGVRASLCDNTLRIDQCQHALTALDKTRRVLFPDAE